MEPLLIALSYDSNRQTCPCNADYVIEYTSQISSYIISQDPRLNSQYDVQISAFVVTFSYFGDNDTPLDDAVGRA